MLKQISVSTVMLHLFLSYHTYLHNITIEQAREAKRARDQIDMRNIRQTAISGASGFHQDKAKALMLAISPTKEGASSGSNFSSTTGVVHINSVDDWRNFETTQDDKSDDTFDRSIDEILRNGPSRGNGRHGSTGDRA